MTTKITGEFELFLQDIFTQINSIQTRAVTLEEIQELESYGNVIPSGSELMFGGDSGEMKKKLQKFKNNIFIGKNIIIFSSSSTGDQSTSSITNNTFTNTYINANSLIKDNAMISNTYIAPGCTVISNGIIGGAPGSVFNLGKTEIVLGEETGSRSLLVHPEMILENASIAISSKKNQNEWNSAIEDSINRIRAISTVYGSFIAGKSTLIKNTELSNLCIRGNETEILSSAISNSVIYGEKSKISNSVVCDSIVHKSTRIESYSFVENSVLCDFVKISVHGKVVHSLVGSYSGVESGECISSLVGPFVGFHHQSLLIATYWPGGRGNVGYGANVGSNHTGKAPDQELVSGEGMFYGLATIIKFPCNFADAPYSLIASGVVCLPQKVTFPFSLINTGSISTLPGFNEIIPAWIISDNMFTLIRNEEKYKIRQNKNASTIYEYEIFRPDIITLVRSARDRLSAITGPNLNHVFTDVEIDGIGKNYLRESSRIKAVDTYSFILRWYALRGLYRRVGTFGLEAVRQEHLREKTSDPTWEFEKSILQSEGLNTNEMKSLLVEFSKLDAIVANSCVTSKGKDDVRGSKIIGPSYNEFHHPATVHSVCVKAKRNAESVQVDIDQLVAKL